jgi:hypothetical protein
MKTISSVVFLFSLLLIPPMDRALGALKLPQLHSAPLTSYIIEGEIVAKGVLLWEEKVSPLNEIHLKREYLVLQQSQSSNDERIVLEFQPLLISIDQFHLGERIQAQLAADGTIVSAKHVQ